MKTTQRLPDLDESLWLDNIASDQLTSGTLERYINDLSVTGSTSNPDDLRPRKQEQHLLRRLSAGVGDSEDVSAEFAKAGIGTGALASPCRTKEQRLLSIPGTN